MTRFLALISCLILVIGMCIGVSAADNNGLKFKVTLTVCVPW